LSTNTTALAGALRGLSLGPAYWHHRRLIRASKTWTREQVRAYEDGIRAHAAYRAVAPGVRDRTFYRERAEGLLESLPGLTYACATSGSTGEPLAFHHSRLAARQKEWAYCHDMWADIGYRPFDTRLYVSGQNQPDLMRFLPQENAWKLPMQSVTKENMPELLRRIRGIGPFYFLTYPSALATIIDVMGEDEFASLPVRAVMAASEVFPRGQMARLRNRFGLPLAHWYGHSEWAVLGHYDFEADRYLFYPTYGLVEFEPLDDGSGECRLIGSRPCRLGTPFIRYDTGDLARPAAEDGVTTFTAASSITGRNQEYFIDRDGIKRAFNPYVHSIHDDFWDSVRRLQVRQQQPGRLRIDVVPGEGFYAARARDVLVDKFREAEIELEQVPAIPLTASGKHRWFVQEMTAAELPDTAP